MADRQQDSVTMVVTHTLKPGSDERFRTWLEGTAAAASAHGGYEGFVLIPPRPGSLERHVAFRYASLDHAHSFWSTEAYAQRREALEELVSEPSLMHRQEIGIEHWFVPRGERPPSRERMLPVVFVAILPLVMTVPPLLGPRLAEFMPTLLANALVTGTIVLLMSYVAMPLSTRLFRAWLRASPRG